MPKSRMTIQDIADAVGVSKTTVSRYFNGKYNYMSDETRRKIEKVIRETGFCPNKLASSLKTARTDMIGLVIPDASSMMTPYLISSVCDECALTRRRTIVVSTHNDVDKEQRLVQELVANQVDGILVATGSYLPLYQQLDESGVPVVYVDRVSPTGIKLDSVTIDHYTACSKAVNKLIDSGYQRIVFTLRASMDGYGTFAPRDEAVRAVCAKRGVKYEKVLANDSFFGDPLLFRKEMKRIYDRCYGEPTALFSGEGILMAYMVSAFLGMGVPFGEDFTLAGYDDTRQAAANGRNLLLINQPQRQMSTMGTRMLIGRIENNLTNKEKVLCSLECSLAIPEQFA